MKQYLLLVFSLIYSTAAMGSVHVLFFPFDKRADMTLESQFDVDAKDIYYSIKSEEIVIGSHKGKAITNNIGTLMIDCTHEFKIDYYTCKVRVWKSAEAKIDSKNRKVSYTTTGQRAEDLFYLLESSEDTFEFVSSDKLLTITSSKDKFEVVYQE